MKLDLKDLDPMPKSMSHSYIIIPLSFRLDHGRPNIRQEFALKLQRTLKLSNDSSLDSSIPYETLAQLKTFIL